MRGILSGCRLRKVCFPAVVVATAALLICYAVPAGCPVIYAGQQQGAQHINPLTPGPVPGPPGTPGGPLPIISNTTGISPPLNATQKDALLKQSFKKTKADVAKLSKLVQALQKEVDKSNANVLSLSIIKQANNIEKLARKIKNESKMY
jgi:hypothetical protein